MLLLFGEDANQLDHATRREAWALGEQRQIHLSTVHAPNDWLPTPPDLNQQAINTRHPNNTLEILRE
jgi:hypothetical protein